MGVFGEGGFTLPKIFSLELSYFWPWTPGAATMDFGNDHLVAKFSLDRGVIPMVNLYGSVSYERTDFMPTILQNGAGSGLSLFDAHTVVSATINYGVTENLDVSLLYTTTAHRDAAGNLVYEEDGSLLPKLDTSLSIMTQIHL